MIYPDMNSMERRQTGKMAYIRMCKNKFPKRCVKCVSIHTRSCRENKVGRGTVPIRLVKTDGTRKE